MQKVYYRDYFIKSGSTGKPPKKGKIIQKWEVSRQCTDLFSQILKMYSIQLLSLSEHMILFSCVGEFRCLHLGNDNVN